MSYENKQVVTGLYYSRIIASFYNVVNLEASTRHNSLLFGIYLRGIRFDGFGCPDESNGRFLTKQEIEDIEELMRNGKMEIEHYLDSWLKQFEDCDDRILVSLYQILDQKTMDREGAE